MRILDHLTGAQGGQNTSPAIDNLAGAFGLAPSQAKAALDAIVPEIAHAIERNTLNRGGIADLVSALGNANSARTLDKGADLAAADVSANGIELLEQIFGSKDKSRAIAARIARQTGLGDGLIKSMLPAVAAMTVAALAKGSRAPLQEVMAKVPGLRAVGPLSGPGASTGNGGNIPRQTPLPIPGDNLPDLQPSPYDDLPDVIRRGDVRVPRNPTGGSSNTGNSAAPASLDSVVRDILGGLLGFQNRGIFGWLLQAIVIPMLLRVVQSVLRRVLTGR